MKRGMRRAKAIDGPPRSDAVGLIGEMIAEEILGDLGAGEPFHIKWRASGSSAARGSDLVFKKGDSLSANECKHLHDMIHGSPDPAVPVSAALRSALEGNSDRRMRDYLARLQRCEARYEEECRARGDRQGRVLCARRQAVLKSAIANAAYSLNAVIMFDAAHRPARGDVGSRAGAGALARFRSPVTAFLVGVDCLHDATEAAIGGRRG